MVLVVVVVHWTHLFAVNRGTSALFKVFDSGIRLGLRTHLQAFGPQWVTPLITLPRLGFSIAGAHQARSTSRLLRRLILKCSTEWRVRTAETGGFLCKENRASLVVVPQQRTVMSRKRQQRHTAQNARKAYVLA